MTQWQGRSQTTALLLSNHSGGSLPILTWPNHGSIGMVQTESFTERARKLRASGFGMEIFS